MNEVLYKFTSRNHITDAWLRNNPNAKYECWFCGRLNDQTDPRQKYCGRSCAKKYWRALRKVPNYRYCDWCGDEFEANRSDKIYCDKKCVQAADRKRKGIPVLAESEVKCGECKRLFIRTYAPQKYCELDCFILHRLASKREYNHAVRDGVKGARGYKKRYRDWLRKEIRVSIDNLAATRGTEFNKDEWNKKAKEVELRLAKRFGQTINSNLT